MMKGLGSRWTSPGLTEVHREPMCLVRKGGHRVIRDGARSDVRMCGYALQSMYSICTLPLTYPYLAIFLRSFG